jgi:hypothetical protein
LTRYNRRHYEKFVNFTDAGVLMDRESLYATSESYIRNCLFVNCGRGVAITFFNYYNEVVEQCEFINCDYGVYAEQWGEVFVRDSHFRNSNQADIRLGDSHKHAVRRCTSVGSNRFLIGRYVNIQDCHVSDWKHEEGVVALLQNTGMNNQMPEGAKQAITAAFDDWAELAEMHERLNHGPEQKRRQRPAR